MSDPIALESGSGWRAATALLWLAIFGTLISIVLWHASAPGVVRLWPWWLALGLEIVAGPVLWKVRGRPSEAIAINGLFITIVALIFLATWTTNDALARAHHPFKAFEIYKLTALFIGLIAPPQARIGLTCVVVAGLLAGIEYWTWPASVRAGISPIEPWAAFVHSAVGVAIYVYRLRTYDLERRATRAEAEITARRRAARMLAATCDLANTPLQTIELSIPLLRVQGQSPIILARIERANERLRHVSRLLERNGAHANAEGGGDLVLDALAILEDAVEQADRPLGPEPSVSPKRID